MPKAGKGDGVRRPVRSAAGGVPSAPSAHSPRLLALAAALPLLAACQPDVVQLSGPTMGSSYHISYVRASGTPEPEAVQAEIRRQLDQLDAAVSTYRNDSDLARFNAAPAGTCQPMPPMALELARSAKQLAADSEGAYDVTLLPVLDAWKFGPKAAREKAQGKTPEPSAPAAGNDKSLTVDQLMAQSGAPKQPSLPPARPSLDADTLASLRAHTGMGHLKIIGDRLCKNAPITVEFNSIAAGYIIDRLAERFANQGIHDYLIEVTGEIRAAGEKPGGHPWLIAIEAPLDHDRKAQRLVQLKDEAISTSGDYRNYREENGRRYSHLIDPRTLAPIEHTLAAATVVTPEAMRADGLSTLLMVLGPEHGYDYAVRHKLAALLVSRTPQGFQTRTTPAFDARFPVAAAP